MSDRRKIVQMLVSRGIVPKNSVAQLESQGMLPKGMTALHGSGREQWEDRERFEEELEEALGDIAEEPLPVMLDLPGPISLLRVGTRAVRSAAVSPTLVVVEAPSTELAAGGLFTHDGQPMVVTDVEDVLFQGTQWSRVTLEER